MTNHASRQERTDPTPPDAMSLLNAVCHHAARLLGHEVQLLRGELKQKARSALVGVGLMVLSVLVALSALNLLITAAVAALVEAGLAASLASLIMGAFALAIAGLLFLTGRTRLRARSLRPERSIENLRRDLETIKERANA